jgi:hypothetical protein
MSSWDGNIVNESHKLNNAQVVRLLAMTELLRDTSTVETVYLIKTMISADEDFDAQALWSDFTENEQKTLWVAPMYGGIFTTEERKRLRPRE